MENTNKLFKKITIIFAVFYCICAISIGIYYIFNSIAYNIMLAFVSMAFLLIPFIIEFVLKLKRNYILHFMVDLYCFLLFMIGMVLEGYIRFKYFDKFVHTLTGCVFAVVGCIVFTLLKPENHTLEKKDFPLLSVFSVSFAMFIAAIWEIFEYIIGIILGTDPQRVLTSGVNDTMQDIIVCLIGALIVVPSIYSYCKEKKTSFCMKLYESFTEISLEGKLENPRKNSSII